MTGTAPIAAAARRRRARRVGFALAALAMPLVATSSAGAAEFEFSRLNRTYSQFVQELQPVVLGPVEVTLRSPRHRLDLARHHVSLQPAADGTHAIALEIELSGSGTINAVLKAAGLEGKLDDDLVLPRQTLRLDGRIRLARSPAGYNIALVEGPEAVEVRIESQLASRLVPLCRNMALVLVRFDCEALSDALSKVQVPLPSAGTEFLLPMEELTPEEIKALDGYLTAGAAR